MVPAMRVFRPSVGKRLMVLMPDSPAVSFAQLSTLPAPNEVTTPRPVTTTSGRPDLSLPVAIFRSPSANAFDQRETFASPVPNTRYDNLCQIPGHWLLQTGQVTGRKQTTTTKRHGSQCDIHGELRLQSMAEICSGPAHGKIGM